MIKALLQAAAALATAGLASAASAQAPATTVQLWRLDCGEIQVSNLDVFSDTFAYAGQQKRLTDSCYLIRHGDDYLLWDTGLPGELAGKTAPPAGPFTMSLKARVTEQLARIGVRADQIDFVGISHNHDDHLGQAADFPKATLLIGAEDFEATAKGPSAARLAPWVQGGGKVEPVAGDRDVFGDGSVVMLDMPGHTTGHHSLLVRLPQTGNVLLTGDLYHFTENMRSHGVPSFNADRSDTLGSFDRFDTIARNLKARVVIQHEPADIAKLPAFPEGAR
jgi:glyoxylase-like metal-dependent hydrolase (beta-lactamase superfamily II)